MGVDYWTPMIAFIRDRLVTEKTVDTDDLRLLMVTDSPEEAIAYIASCAVPAAEAAGGHSPTPTPVLGESARPKTAPAAR